MSPAELALLSRWTERRDAEAFTELVKQYSGMVFHTARRILRNSADAEDVAQECFLRLAEAKAEVHSSLGGWLHVLATHRALDRLRTDAHRRQREREHAAAEAAALDEARADILAAVDAIIAELPENLRVPLTEHFLFGRTHAEVAESLGLSRSAITQRIEKGVEEVRARLAREGLPVVGSLLVALLAEQAAEAAPATLLSALGKLGMAGATPAAPVLTTTASLAGFLFSAKSVLVATVLVVGLAAWWVHRNATATPPPPPALTFNDPVSQARMTHEAVRPLGAAVEPATAAIPQPAVAATVASDVPAGPLTGRVVTVDGSPVAGARVLLFHNVNRWGPGNCVVEETRSRQDGGFTLTKPIVFERKVNHSYGQDSYILLALHRDYALGWANLTQAKPELTGPVVLSASRSRTFTVTDTEGKPLPGARVWLSFAGGRTDPDPLFRDYLELPTDVVLAGAVTDKTGVAVVGSLPATDCSFYADLPGYARGWAFNNGRRFRLSRGASVAGKIADTSGNPVAGVDVVFAADFMNNYVYTRTDAEGRYRTADLAPQGWDMSPWGRGASSNGRYRVSFKSDVYTAPEEEIALEPGQVVEDFDFMAQIGSQVLCRVLREESGDPVAGARLRFDSAVGNLNAYTDEVGCATFVTIPGEASVFLFSPPEGIYIEYDAQRLFVVQRIHVSGASMEVIVPFPANSGKLVTVCGSIVAPLDRPANVMVYADGGQFVGATKSGVPSAPVDADGWFTFPEVPEGHALYVYAESRDRTWAGCDIFAVSRPPAPAPVLSLALEPTVKAEVQLLDKSGKPLARRRLKLRPQVDGRYMAFHERQATTDDAGKLSLSGILPGLPYVVEDVEPVLNPDSQWYAQRFLRTLVLAPGTDRFPPRADAPPRFRGRLLDEAGTPIVGATIERTLDPVAKLGDNDPGGYRQGTTDDSGIFTVRINEAGYFAPSHEVHVFVRLPGGEQHEVVATVAPGSLITDFVVRESAAAK